MVVCRNFSSLAHAIKRVLGHFWVTYEVSPKERQCSSVHSCKLFEGSCCNSACMSSPKRFTGSRKWRRAGAIAQSIALLLQLEVSSARSPVVGTIAHCRLATDFLVLRINKFRISDAPNSSISSIEMVFRFLGGLSFKEIHIVTPLSAGEASSSRRRCGERDSFHRSRGRDALRQVYE